MSDIHFSVTTSTVTDSEGRFETPISLTHSLSFEAYVKGKGMVARELRLPDASSSLYGVVLQLHPEGADRGVVRLIAPNDEDLRGERIKLIRIDSKAGYYSPLSRVDRDGWLNTRWLIQGAKYVGRFDSKKFRDFFFCCKIGEVVKLEPRPSKQTK